MERWSEDAAGARRPNCRMRWLLQVSPCSRSLVGWRGILCRSNTGARSPLRLYIDDMDLPPGTRHFGGVALSPDGTRLAIVTQSNTIAADPRLWVRKNYRGGRRVATGVRRGPRDRQIPILVAGQFLARLLQRPTTRARRRANVRTGRPLRRAGWRGGAWLDDGTLVFAPTSDPWRVSARGGSPSTLVTRGQGVEAYTWLMPAAIGCTGRNTRTAP